MPHRPSLAIRLLQLLGGCVLVPLAACAPQACSQPDVVAYVDRTAASRDLAVIGLAEPIGQRDVAGRPVALCSGWMVRRNVAYRPGSTLPPTLRVPQGYSVRTVAEGYEVRLLPPPGLLAGWVAPGPAVPLTR